ncbi:MAG: peptide ABC transporter permease [Candidatus Tectimicrobiota bacterium]|nr:MAG: peptide ABC transporter permease [Candidatus Tectomicrobia bacterium]
MRRLLYTAKRLALMVPTLFGLVVLVFVISRVIPADPVALLAGERATPQQIEALRHRYGLDRPLPVQLLAYLRQLARGDLGTSLYSGRPITTDLFGRFPATLELTLAAMAITVLLGVPLGVLAALYRNSWFDHLLRAVTVSGLAIASFWLAIMLQLLFSMELRLLPLGGRIGVPPPRALTGLFVLDALLTGNGAALRSALQHLCLPAFTLAFPALATVVRFTRAGVLDVLHSDFILYERAMGLPRPLIVGKYLLRNAMAATLTQIGLLFGVLLAGAVVVETVFDWPGIGLYAVNAIVLSDYNAILGFTLWSGFLYVLVNLLTDLGLMLLDPREATR